VCRSQCELTLHSLVNNYELIGATRIARLVVDCEARATDFGPLQLHALNRLHTETLSALNAPDAPLAGAAASSSIHLQRAAAVAAPMGPAGGALFIAAIDDASFARQHHQLALFPALGADMTRSAAIGETKSEQLGFIDFALGRVDAALRPLAPPHREADMVLLDEDIALNNETHMLGSQLAGQLRGLGYGGVTCIISGVDDEHLAALIAMPDVDMVSPKNFNPTALAAKLLNAHKLKTAASRFAPGAGELFDLSHFDGLPHENICSLLKAVWDDTTVSSAEPASVLATPPKYTSDVSMFARMAELQKRVEHGESLAGLVHSLKGVALTAGASTFAKVVQAFPTKEASAATNAEGIATLWALLESTRREMQARGYVR